MSIISNSHVIFEYSQHVMLIVKIPELAQDEKKLTYTNYKQTCHMAYVRHFSAF